MLLIRRAPQHSVRYLVTSHQNCIKPLRTSQSHSVYNKTNHCSYQVQKSTSTEQVPWCGWKRADNQTEQRQWNIEAPGKEKDNSQDGKAVKRDVGKPEEVKKLPTGSSGKGQQPKQCNGTRTSRRQPFKRNKEDEHNIIIQCMPHYHRRSNNMWGTKKLWQMFCEPKAKDTTKTKWGNM